MSEVKRYGRIGDMVEATEGLLKLYPMMSVYVLATDFDRVTAERDAALKSLDSADASAQTLHEVICRLRSERDAALAAEKLLITVNSDLQKRLTAAINKVLTQTEGFGGVDSVYFKSFIIQ